MQTVDPPVLSRLFTSVGGLAAQLAGVVLLGLVSRRVFEGVPILGAELGDALYAVMIYLVLRLVILLGRSSWTASRASVVSASAAGLICFAVEAFQRTGVPQDLAERPGSGRLWALVLGQGFRWWDLVALAVGVLVAFVVDVGSRRALRQP